jgi:hypothetical protein
MDLKPPKPNEAFNSTQKASNSVT